MQLKKGSMKQLRNGVINNVLRLSAVFPPLRVLRVEGRTPLLCVVSIKALQPAT